MSYFNDIFFINIAKRTASGYTSELIKNTAYSIEFIAEGKIFLTIDGKRFLLEPQTVFWMLPGKTYQFVATENTPVKHLWIDFQGARAKRMMKCIAKRIPSGMLKASNSLDFETIFEKMLKIYKNYPLNRRFEAVVCLEQLAGLIYSSAMTSEAAEIKYEFIAELADKIKVSPLKPVDFKKEASKSGLSYEHFRKLFKEYNGMPPYEYLLRCKMEYAAEIITGEMIQVKEAAEICGFDEISSFSRMFKRKMSVSPSYYVKTAKKHFHPL
jgi:AraC-like DNA-binding protein